MNPLSEHALAELREIAKAPVPCCRVNPGVVDRLLRGGLVNIVYEVSPFPTHKGKQIQHLRITEVGRGALEGPAE